MGKFVWEVEDQMSYAEFSDWCAFYRQMNEEADKTEELTADNVMGMFGA